MTASQLNLLTFYGHHLGRQTDAIASAQAESRKRRIDPLSMFVTEYGPLNRLVTLGHAHTDGIESERKRFVDTSGMDWLNHETLHYALEPRRCVKPDLLGAPLIELRMYATQAGQRDNFLNAMLTALPHRERYSPCAGIWSTHERGWDVVVHLWAYEDLQQRSDARTRSGQDPDWGSYRTSIRPFLARMQAMLLVPVANK